MNQKMINKIKAMVAGMLNLNPLLMNDKTRVSPEISFQWIQNIARCIGVPLSERAYSRVFNRDRGLTFGSMIEILSSPNE